MTYYKILAKGSSISQAINLKVLLNASYNPQLNNETMDYDWVEGSKTIHLGSGGGEIKIKPVFYLKRKEYNDINNVKKLHDWAINGKELTVVYADEENYTNLFFGGNYKITDFDLTEPKKGKYEVSLTLQKQAIFPTETKSFTNWVQKSKSSTSKSKNTLSSAYIALSKCKLPLYKDHAGKNKSTNCDLLWQKMLRKFNFYYKYNGHSLKLDGYFGIYTQDATRKFQKKYKIKVTGKLDKTTLALVKKLILKEQKKTIPKTQLTVHFPKVIGGVIVGGS